MKLSLVILSLILLITSCASSRRLKRVFQEDRTSENKKADRVNAFPLFYANGEESSLLWPLMDSDKHGFSIRPFFNKEGNEYAALFPLSAWNPVKGDGWIGPFYWDKDRSVLFPLYYRDKQHLQVLTYYQSEDRSVLFPLFYKDKDTTQILTYFYGKDYKCLFPLFYKDKNNMQILTYFSGKDRSILFPLFYKDKDITQILTYFSCDEFSCFFPFYAQKNGVNQKGFYTLLGGYSQSGSKKDTMITPLWWSGSSATGSYKTLLPIFHHNENGQDETTYLFPWFSSKDASSDHKILLPFYQALKTIDKEGNVTKDGWQVPMFFPIAGKETNDSGSRTSSLGGLLFDHEVIGKMTKGDFLFCMADWQSDLDSRRFRFPALFSLPGLLDISQKGNTSKFDFLFFLYSHEKKPGYVKRDIFPGITWDSGENESSFSFLWRVFERHDRNGKKGGHVFFIPYGA